jgi:LuxR family maltose regulon positive regulatory protein
MKALLADTKGEEDKAVALLREAVILGQPGRLIRPLVDLGVGLIKLLNRLDLDSEGLQYIGTILSAFQAPGDSNISQANNEGMIESLSERELEVLRQLAKNLSNKEIGDTLFISPGTVKRHAHNIYGKLAVNKRRDAVSKAIGLGILKAD